MDAGKTTPTEMLVDVKDWNVMRGKLGRNRFTVRCGDGAPMDVYVSDLEALALSRQLAALVEQAPASSPSPSLPVLRWQGIAQLVEKWRKEATREVTTAQEGGNVLDQLAAGDIARAFRECADELEQLISEAP